MTWIEIVMVGMVVAAVYSTLDVYILGDVYQPRWKRRQNRFYRLTNRIR